MSAGHGSPLPFFDDLKGFARQAQKQAGLNVSGPTAITVFAALNLIFFLAAPYQAIQNFELLIFISPLWLPYLLYSHASLISVINKHKEYHLEPKQRPVLLEMRMPRDTMKSPLAMEAVLLNLALAPGESTWWKRLVQGRTRPWWSLEITSTEGLVRFYIWTWKSQRRALESYVYAQYPNVELIETTDYSRLVDPSHHPYEMWTAEYTYTSPNPFPLKSYVDYGLDKNPKPEEQVDPLSQVLEVLSSLGKGEHIWIQFLISAHVPNRSPQYAGMKNKKGQQYTIVDHGMEIIEDIRTAIERSSTSMGPDGKTQIKTSFPNPTRGQTELIAEVEKTIYKQSYDVGIRSMYFAPEDKYIGATGSHLGNIFKPFGGSNKLGAVGGVETFYGYPWEDRGGKRLKHVLHEAVGAYRRRAFFHHPYVGAPMIMSVEELATLFHVPSSTAGASGLPRIPSATAEAPSNLPT